MPTIPYIISFEETVPSGTAFEFSYQLSDNRTLEIVDMIISSAGIFDIIELRNVNGDRYANASQANPIDGSHVKDSANDFNHVNLFPIPVLVNGGETFYLRVIDKSGSDNLMNVTLVCKMTKERNA